MRLNIQNNNRSNEGRKLYSKNKGQLEPPRILLSNSPTSIKPNLYDIIQKFQDELLFSKRGVGVATSSRRYPDIFQKRKFEKISQLHKIPIISQIRDDFPNYPN